MDRVSWPSYESGEPNPRLTVELWELLPVPSETHPYFEGMYFDERGLGFKYSDGDYLKPKTYEMQVVFSGSFESVRMNPVSVCEDEWLFSLAGHAGLKEDNWPSFLAFRCKYTSFFNWCVQKRFGDSLEQEGYHYVLAAVDTLVEVFCTEPPRVFFDGYGLNIPEDSCERFPASNLLYRHHSIEH